MLLFLLVISFLLHGVTIFILVTLSLRVNKNKELEMKQEKVAKEIEESFTAYLIEIKEENQRLMNMLDESGQTVDTNAPSVESKNYKASAHRERPKDKVEQYERDYTSYSHEPSIHYSEQKMDNGAFNPMMPDNQGDSFEPSMQSSIYQLYDQGYSKEDIAKKLNCGKTEIELMLKFHS
ncbi:hypothetical protein GLW08_01370 [Pontibacillus yanchengensis]|uniref:Uncharacterized protein n=2 Tax=Pontibacillus yanchengensis TaxID=462910 RepID=A0ACC7VCS2_9BACI|nr:hypothetical protein [Pontibacillus yanchengensis]MYL33171.1 hypothetical protein [Pontibacillus yanchengensis]MYL51979.1 hypothetical protein [Pontibacillus yanchengensis]